MRPLIIKRAFLSSVFIKWAKQFRINSPNSSYLTYYNTKVQPAHDFVNIVCDNVATSEKLIVSELSQDTELMHV